MQLDYVVSWFAAGIAKKPGKSWSKSPHRYRVALYRAHTTRDGRRIWRAAVEIADLWDEAEARALASAEAARRGCPVRNRALHNEPVAEIEATVLKERAAELVQALDAIPLPALARPRSIRRLRLEAL